MIADAFAVHEVLANTVVGLHAVVVVGALHVVDVESLVVLDVAVRVCSPLRS